MSPKNQVSSLNYLCIKQLSTQIIYALSDDEGLHYNSVSEYFSDATYEVLEELLKNILNSINLDAATRFSCLQVLLRQDVKKLDIGIFPHSYYEAILKVISERGTGLHQLNLKGVWARDYPDLLCQLVASLTKLKILIVPHMVDNQVLETIVQCSCSLSVLDISGECLFTRQGLELLKGDTLAVLELGSFGKKDVCQHNAADDDENDYELVGRIIENLPSLISLRIYSFTGNALYSLHNRNVKHQTKLKYLHDTNTTNEIVEALIEICPNLESIHIDKAEDRVIKQLVNFKKLNSVKLTRYNAEELMSYLRRTGDQIQILKLNNNKDKWLDLSDVCLCVPNLTTLECYQIKITYAHLDNYFMCLQNVEILYCDISDTTLKTILKNSPFLKRVIIGCVINMTDGDIFRLCAECQFICLEELWLSCARALTSTSVELLMGNCPNLKVLGQLSGWDIHQEEIDYIRSIILFTNTDLTLLPVN